MKIGIVSPYYYPNLIGGAEVSVKLLAEQLVKRGHEVLVLTFDFDSKLKGYDIINGVKVVRYRTYTKEALLFTLIPYVLRAMKKWESHVDLYHVYNVFPMAGAGLYKILGGKTKVIATLNNYAAFCPVGTAIYNCKICCFSKRFKCLIYQSKSKTVSILYAALYPFLTYVSKRIDKYIALNEIVKELYVSNGFDEKRIEVIPNFVQVDLKRKSSYLKYCHRTNEDTFNILYVGRISKSKGVDVLIKAFSRVSLKHDEVRLVLVGDGQNIDYYKRMVKNLGIEDKVTFTGRLGEEEKEVYYSKADVFVHPGNWPEPFGRTILEAMSFQIPLVVSNIGAPPKIVERAGLIFEHGDTWDLERKIEALIINSELRDKLRLGCLETVKKYAPESILSKITELYERVLVT